MPQVRGEGPVKEMDSVDVKQANWGKQNTPLDGFVVPWGFYYYGYWDHRTRQLATSSLGSCFAIVCHHLETNKIFFAHVANDDETTSIVNAITRVNPQADGYTCVIVMGTDPNKLSTMKRINRVLAVAKYGFHVFRSDHGGASYDIEGNVGLGGPTVQKSTVDPNLVRQAMSFMASGPLRRIEGSLDLASQ